MTPLQVALRTAQVVALSTVAGLLLLAVLPPPTPPGSPEAIVTLLRRGRPLEAACLFSSRPAEGDTTLLGSLSEDDRSTLATAALDLGSRLLDRDEIPTVEALLPRLGRLARDDAPFRVLRGRIHEASRRTEAALESFAAALTLDPSCAEAVTRLASLRSGDPDALHALGLRLGQARVTIPGPYLRLAERLEGASRLHQARAVYDAALAAGVTDPLIRSRRELLAAFMTARTPSGPDEADEAIDTVAADAEAPAAAANLPGTPPGPPVPRTWPRSALATITSQGYVGMDSSDLVALAGEPTHRRTSPLPATGLFALGPRPERWDYVADDGGGGVVVQVVDGRITALGPYTRSSSPKGGAR